MWVLYSIFVAIIMAMRRITNQHFQMSGSDLVLASKGFLVFLCLPFVPFIDWPTSPWFYVLTIITGPLAYYKDKQIYIFTAQFGAGPITRVEPLSVPVVFLTWLAIDWSLLQAQLAQPFTFAGIITCIMASVYFATRLRNCVVSKQVLTAMIPLILSAAALNLFGKGCTEFMPSANSVVSYVFVQAIIVSIIAIYRTGPTKTMALLHPSNARFLKVGIGLAISLLAVTSLRLLAFKETANPAYATSIMLMGPFIVLIFNRMLRHKEEGNIANGVGIVCAAIGLALLTNL